MKKITLSAVAVLSFVSGFSSTLSASDDFTLFSNAKVNGEVKARYEYVDIEDSGKMNANAYTVRATLGLETTLLGIEGLSLKVDGTTVQTIGGTRYDNLSLTKDTRYEVVADPEQTRFTQGYLQYKLGETTAKVGRQLVNLDTQRFIGSVDWRQMPQSLDAVSLANTSIPGLSLYGAYVYSYATVFDERTYGQSLKSESLILNTSYKVNDMLKITAYDYMLSLEKDAFAADTYGLSFNGDIPAGPAKIGYRAEYAKQGDSTFDKYNTSIKGQNDAYYYDLEALANISGVLVGVGYEMLSGGETNAAGTAIIDEKTAFSTPLATLHKFNGWADKFLTTPKGGLIDTSATLGYTASGLGKAMVVYHDFETDKSMAGKSDLGTEWDMLYTNAIPAIKGLNGLLKAAFYEGGDVNTFNKNKTVFWAEIDYKF
jgi:hypothetical protein